MAQCGQAQHRPMIIQGSMCFSCLVLLNSQWIPNPFPMTNYHRELPGHKSDPVLLTRHFRLTESIKSYPILSRVLSKSQGQGHASVSHIKVSLRSDFRGKVSDIESRGRWWDILKGGPGIRPEFTEYRSMVNQQGVIILLDSNGASSPSRPHFFPCWKSSTAYSRQEASVKLKYLWIPDFDTLQRF